MISIYISEPNTFLKVNREFLVPKNATDYLESEKYESFINQNIVEQGGLKVLKAVEQVRE